MVLSFTFPWLLGNKTNERDSILSQFILSQNFANTMFFKYTELQTKKWLKLKKKSFCGTPGGIDVHLGHTDFVSFNPLFPFSWNWIKHHIRGLQWSFFLSWTTNKTEWKETSSQVGRVCDFPSQFFLIQKWLIIPGTTWMNLENISLRERSKTQKTTCCVIPFLWNVQSRQIHRDRKQISGCQGLGQRGGGEEMEWGIAAA